MSQAKQHYWTLVASPLALRCPEHKRAASLLVRRQCSACLGARTMVFDLIWSGFRHNSKPGEATETFRISIRESPTVKGRDDHICSLPSTFFYLSSQGAADKIDLSFHSICLASSFLFSSMAELPAQKQGFPVGTPSPDGG